jgi:hypothetical protein
MRQPQICGRLNEKFSEIIEQNLLLANLGKYHVIFCHHLASVVRRRPCIRQSTRRMS